MIKIKGGREIKIERVIIRRTYNGLFAHDNDLLKINSKIFDRISCPSEWGENLIVKFRPQESFFLTTLPPMVYYAWLSSTPKNEQYDGSQMLISWFDNDLFDRPLNNMILSLIYEADWDKLSTDYHL